MYVEDFWEFWEFGGGSIPKSLEKMGVLGYNGLMVQRERYLRKLRMLRDVNVIKVITGIRRCGKSTVMDQFRQELIESGVDKRHVIYFNLEEKENEAFLQDKDALYNLIMQLADKNAKNYVFLDEVQMVPEFERMIDSLFVKDYIDLYITGSNAYLTSSEIGTLLTGRYIEIKMQPLTFSEFTKFFPDKEPASLFTKYMNFGGFPEVANLLVREADEAVNPYLSSIYNTILEKDIRGSGNVRSMEDFRRVAEFLFDNIGNLTSANNIANAMLAVGKTIDRKTVDGFIEKMRGCFLFYEASRYDIRGKELLKTGKKYYTVDLGLSNVVLGKASDADIGRKLENMVYLELLQRYGEVFVGKNFEKEIDFVVRNAEGVVEYYQVAETAQGETLERELASLKNTGNQYKKTILTMDAWGTDEDGIERKNVMEWLLAGG